MVTWKEFTYGTTVFVWACLWTISKETDGIELLVSIAISPMLTYSIRKLLMCLSAVKWIISHSTDLLKTMSETVGTTCYELRVTTWVTSAAPVAANLPTDHLQAGGNHLQDTIYWQPGLLISPHPRLSTSTHTTIIRQTVTFCTADDTNIVSKSFQR